MILTLARNILQRELARQTLLSYLKIDTTFLTIYMIYHELCYN